LQDYFIVSWRYQKSSKKKDLWLFIVNDRKLKGKIFLCRLTVLISDLADFSVFFSSAILYRKLFWLITQYFAEKPRLKRKTKYCAGNNILLLRKMSPLHLAQTLYPPLPYECRHHGSCIRWYKMVSQTRCTPAEIKRWFNLFTAFRSTAVLDWINFHKDPLFFRRAQHVLRYYLLCVPRSAWMPEL